jgi:hypothetical protein
MANNKKNTQRQSKEKTSIDGKKLDEIISLKKSIKEIKEMMVKLEKRISGFEATIKNNGKIKFTKQETAIKLNKPKKKPNSQNYQNGSINSKYQYALFGNGLLKRYIDETKKQTKLVKQEVENKNNKIARKASRDALEAVVDADIYINQYKSITKMDIKLVNELHELYKETNILVKSIYGDERPVLDEDSIAGDDY